MELVERAAAYHSRIASGGMTPEDWLELEAWTNESPENLEALESMGSMAQTFRVLGDAKGASALPDSLGALGPMLEDARGISEDHARKQTRWRAWPAAIAASVLVVLGLFFVLDGRQAPVPEMLVFEAGVGERRSVTLADGSAVEINADSRFTAAIGESSRQLVLEHGEVFIDVASDPARPFDVEAGGHLVSVTGTAFNVRFRNAPARVIVSEGRVTVSEEENPSGAQELRAGQMVVLDGDMDPVDLSPQELQNSLNWRDGWLHFEDQRLAEVVSQLDPHVEKRIVIGSRRAGNLEVAGSFNVDNTDALLTTLETILPVTVTYKDELIVIDYAEQ